MKPFPFLDPETKAPLSRQTSGDGEVLLSENGTEYPVQEGIHDLTYPRELSEEIEELKAEISQLKQRNSALSQGLSTKARQNVLQGNGVAGSR